MNSQTNCLQLNLSFNISSSLMLNKFQMYMQWQANIDTITATNTGTNTDTNKFTNTDAIKYMSSSTPCDNITV